MNCSFPRRAAAIVALFTSALSAAPLQHDFLAIDEGLSDLMHVDEAKPAKNWPGALTRPSATCN